MHAHVEASRVSERSTPTACLGPAVTVSNVSGEQILILFCHGLTSIAVYERRMGPGTTVLDPNESVLRPVFEYDFDQRAASDPHLDILHSLLLSELR